MQFKNPPIVELVVELKWASVGASPIPAGFPPGLPYPEEPSTAQEKFLADFQQSAASAGWKRSERMIPPGFPYLRFQPVLRIRSDDRNRSSIVLQVGPGVFSVHALSPYKNWETFWPVAHEGIGLLLGSRQEAERSQPFFSASVMYIDVFGESIIGNATPAKFLQDVLGFGITLPEAVKMQALDEDKVDIQFSIKFPLRNELDMALVVNGNAVWGDKTGLLMRMIVSSRRNVLPELGDVSEICGNSHLAIRRTFVGITEKIHSMMLPVGDES